MKKIEVYIVNVDEDIAEKVFNKAVDAISELELVIIAPGSVTVEPHDDYRGVAASFKYNYLVVEANKNKNASRLLQDLVQSLVKAQLWNVSAVRVLTETGDVS